MSRQAIERVLLVAVAALGTILVGLGPQLLSAFSAEPLPPIVANDNRVPAGEVKAGIVTVNLDIRKGIWHPEAETGEAIPVYAFGETGKPLQDPGPTIRVTEGTTLDITLHNQLAVPATVHGLHQRPGNDTDVITVAAGGTEHVRFLAGTPGTYLYSARTPDGSRGANRVADSQLGGALVVDAAGPSVPDRIFVLERFNGTARTAINGKSWPFTERLNYVVGDKVRYRLINASDNDHPMHMHGGDFQLDALGDGETYTAYAPGTQPLEFTQTVGIGDTADIIWTPMEPGRWLFHCHRLAHMRMPVALDAADVLVADNHDNMHDMMSDYDGMGGMIMGITVTGPPRADLDTTAATWKPERQLSLTVASQNGDPRFYQLSLRDLAPSAAKHQDGTVEPSAFVRLGVRSSRAACRASEFVDDGDFHRLALIQ